MELLRDSSKQLTWRHKSKVGFIWGRERVYTLTQPNTREIKFNYFSKWSNKKKDDDDDHNKIVM